MTELPLLLKAWAPTRHRNFRGRARVGTSLVRRLVKSGEVYCSPEGLMLSVDPHDYFQACMLLGIYEPHMTSLIERHVTPGSVALDIGHHIGYFTLKMAHGVGPGGEVHAFDPDPRAHDRLRAHVRSNDILCVTSNRSAVTNRGGTIDLLIPDQLGWASTKPVIQAEETISVPAVTIDDYLAERGIHPARVSFIKLDVEAAELEALEGMRSTLAAGKPVTVVELFPDRLDQRAEQVLALMGELGYRPSGARGDVVFAKMAS